jgi:hypothetical protein
MFVLIFFLTLGVVWWKEKYWTSVEAGMGEKVGWLAVLTTLFVGASWLLPHIYVYMFSGLLLASPVVALLQRSNNWQSAGLLFLFIIINLCALLLSIPFAYFRYLAPLIPLFSILTAVMIELTAKLHFSFAGLIVVGLIVNNPLLDDHLAELRQEYVGPMQGIVRYLQTHASASDTVLITYEDLPLKFYTDMKVVGGLTGETLAPYTNPQWIILRKYYVGLEDSTIRRHVWANVDLNNYENISIPYPDIPYQNREEPRDHHFTTVLGADSIHILHRKR